MPTASQPRYLIDTNVLVYAHDRQAGARRERAAAVLRHLHRGAPGAAAPGAALPAQALAEFARITLSKLSPPLAPQVVYEQVRLFEEAFEVLPLTPSVVLEAVRGHGDHSFSYFDAQIWAAAKLAQIPVILSEDFSPGSVVEGVSFLDPLDESINLAEL